MQKLAHKTNKMIQKPTTNQRNMNLLPCMEQNQQNWRMLCCISNISHISWTLLFHFYPCQINLLNHCNQLGCFKHIQIPICQYWQVSCHRALDCGGSIWVILVVVEVFPEVRESKFSMFRWPEVTEVQFFHIFLKCLLYGNNLQNRCTNKLWKQVISYFSVNSLLVSNTIVHRDVLAAMAHGCMQTKANTIPIMTSVLLKIIDCTLHCRHTKIKSCRQI